MKDLTYTAPGPDTGDWRVRHNQAVAYALDTPNRANIGGCLVRAIHQWLLYAVAHDLRYESQIGEDYVLGPAWEQWGRALRTMLNGETGDLDCGTLDSIILDNLIEQGFTEE